jgi:uncharacterized RDD family membrane protein YckC
MSELVTGEAVVLDLPVAYFPGRIAALLIDYAIQLVLLIGFGFAMAALLGSLNDDYLIAAYLALYVAIAIGYPTAFETLTRGKTPGKMALGIRVVGDDGSPVRFRQAFVRSLVGLFELASLVLMPVALITSLGSAKGKRLGDMFAGTYVVQDRMPARPPLHRDFAVVPFPLEGWAQTAEVSRLSPAVRRAERRGPRGPRPPAGQRCRSAGEPAAAARNAAPGIPRRGPGCPARAGSSQARSFPGASCRASPGDASGAGPGLASTGGSASRPAGSGCAAAGTARGRPGRFWLRPARLTSFPAVIRRPGRSGSLPPGIQVALLGFRQLIDPGAE